MDGEIPCIYGKIIKFGNSYSQTYRNEYSYNTSIKFSPSQIQVVEYILENEEKCENMAETALRLGISKSAFSKHVQKMVSKGLLEKFHTSDNRKDVIIKVSDFGREIYRTYSDYAYQTAFKHMFELLDTIPKEYLDRFTEVLDIASQVTADKKEPPQTIELIKIEQN